MYLDHYGLEEKPFQISTDPKFLWLGEKHKEALATLKYGILDNKGFLLLTGDVGTGKTTLINSLLENLEDRVIVATVPDPGLEKMDFFNFISYKFKIKKKMATKGDFLVYFSHFLHWAYNKGKKVLLIIDEAQRLDQELLEEVRLLSNIEHQDTKLINIFFIGQNEFNDILWQNKNRAIRQRMTLSYNLKPLTEKEIADYIRHRLKVAGTTKKIFTSDAICEIYLFSGGYPRKINIVCDHALLSGFVKESKKITGEIVKECAEELKIPGVESNEIEAGHEKDAAIEELKKEIEEIREHTTNRDGALKQPSIESIPPPKKVNGWLKVGISIVFLSLILGSIIYWIGSAKQIEPKIKISEVPTNGTTQFGGEGGVNEKRTLTNEKDRGPKNQIKEAVNNDRPSVGRKALKNDNIKNHFKKADQSPPVFPRKTLVISFGHDSTALSEKALSVLDDYVRRLKPFPDAKVNITGFTDDLGNPGYNQSLAEFRAISVKTYLIGKGIPGEKIKAEGQSAKAEHGSDDSLPKQQIKRRVEIIANR